MGQLAVSQRDEKGERQQAEATKLVKNREICKRHPTERRMLLAIIDVQGRSSGRSFCSASCAAGAPSARGRRRAAPAATSGRALRQQRPGRDRRGAGRGSDGARPWRPPCRRTRAGGGAELRVNANLSRA